MKYIYNIAALFLATMFLASCGPDFLSPAPTAAVGATTYYSTEAELETGVINMYDGIQGVNILAITSTTLNHSIQFEYYLTEMRSDNTRTKSQEGEAAQFEFYNIEPNNGIVEDYYRSMYDIIFRANTVLANLGVASAETATAYEAEAKFVRAYAYFNLVRLWGDVPLIDEVISLFDTETQFTRVSTDGVYDLIISDLQTAAAGLTDASKTRASKSAAQAMLAKVYLTTGNYPGAKTLVEEVMNAGFELEANFKDVFFDELNNEIIFAIGYIGDDTNDSQSISTEWLNAVGRTAGVNYLTNECAAFLDEFGGLRTEYSYRQDQLQFEQNQVVKYLPDGDSNLGIEATSSDARRAGNDWIEIRYADVLLMHAEATIGAGNGLSTTDPLSLGAFNAVRDRAGLDPVNSISKEELLIERRAELAFENQRFFDLARFGVMNDVLGEFAAENGAVFTGTDALLPIPTREINLSNGVLTQNPGY